MFGSLEHKGKLKFNNDSSLTVKKFPTVHRYYKKLPERLKKWAVPWYMYTERKFPPFLTGHAYVMTKAAAECVLERSKVSFGPVLQRKL